MLLVCPHQFTTAHNLLSLSLLKQAHFIQPQAVRPDLSPSTTTPRGLPRQYVRCQVWQSV